MRAKWVSQCVFLGWAFSQSAYAADPDRRPASMEELLSQVRDHARQEAVRNKAREADFNARKDLQAQKLKEAREALAAEQARFDLLSQRFREQQEAIAVKRDALAKTTADLGELFGVMRKVAGEASAVMQASLVGVQYPGQVQAVREVAQSKTLASQAQIEGLWQAMLSNMVKSGSVERFEGTLVQKDGTMAQAPILRVGSFSAFSNGSYLRHLPAAGDSVKLIELARQPAPEYRRQAAGLQDAPVGEVQVVSIDPSRGAVVELLVQSPSWKERLRQGGVIGYIILALGGLGILIAVERLIYLTLVATKVNRQKRRPHAPLATNPLGRLLLVAQEHRETDAEALLLRLEEQLSHELPRLKRGLGVIALFAATTPLLGLLGTVTGMIETFQSITLFGNGDPKMMSGGISQALVTTKLGLATAIPLMLVHAFVNQRANKVGHSLDTQSTQSVAERLSEDSSGGGA